MEIIRAFWAYRALRLFYIISYKDILKVGWAQRIKALASRFYKVKIKEHK
jgi:hypothetical protein